MPVAISSHPPETIIRSPLLQAHIRHHTTGMFLSLCYPEHSTDNLFFITDMEDHHPQIMDACLLLPLKSNPWDLWPALDLPPAPFYATIAE